MVAEEAENTCLDPLLPVTVTVPWLPLAKFANKYACLAEPGRVISKVPLAPAAHCQPRVAVELPSNFLKLPPTRTALEVFVKQLAFK